MEAIIVYKGALAYYTVICERSGVYSAYLKEYRGDEPPPSSITLVKGIRHWTGSIDDDVMLNDIGQSIDRQSKFEPNESKQSTGRRRI